MCKGVAGPVRFEYFGRMVSYLFFHVQSIIVDIFTGKHDLLAFRHAFIFIS